MSKIHWFLICGLLKNFAPTVIMILILFEPNVVTVHAVPGLTFSTYLGGSDYDGYSCSGIVDTEGNVYITGSTYSLDFPSTTGAYDTYFNGSQYDVFVSKLSADGVTLIYSTAIGRAYYEEGKSIAVDPLGQAYITGWTDAKDFPTTRYAYDTTPNGRDEVFVCKLSAAGDVLLFSTFLGGSDVEGPEGIDLDNSYNPCVTGWTVSNNFPTTSRAYDKNFDSVNGDVFVSKLNTEGTELIFSTALGNADADYGQAIALDAYGNAHITGVTYSREFPTTPGAFDTKGGGGGDVFVTKLNEDGSALLYSTYLGGVGAEKASGIAIHEGFAYVTGNTNSKDFPATPGAYDSIHNGNTDMFITKLAEDGSSLVFSTYLGGSLRDGFFSPSTVAIDSDGLIYVSGTTESTDFPTTPDAYDGSFNGVVDVCLTKFRPDGGALIYSTFIGGRNTDYNRSVFVTEWKDVYIIGVTESTDFPTTTLAYDKSHNGNWDIFASKFHFGPEPDIPVLKPAGWIIVLAGILILHLRIRVFSQGEEEKKRMVH